MRILLSAVGLLSLLQLSSQSFTTENYYLFPINPGQQNFLAGTMGELRSSHFHAGLDIKTGGQEGLPIYATADGYISRIKVSSGGYGYALYMYHPNGTTSVYAHCQRFADEIDQYVLEKQYEEQAFEIELFPDKDQFVFRQGEIIAYSGNTGSSSGPHLHFEIRDSNQRILDPLRFGFKEIKDDIAPIIKNIAFVTLDGKARVNDTFGRVDFDVIKSGNIYTTRSPIVLKGNVGIEYYGYDLLDGAYNRNGIPKATLVIDEDTVFNELKSSLSFGNQRNILVHMDYDAFKHTGRKYSKLFVEDGNTNDFYTYAPERYFFDDSVHTIKIFLEDSYGNITSFETEVNTRQVLNKPEPAIDKFEVYRNHLHFKANYTRDPDQVRLFFGAAYTDIIPYRLDRKTAYYLWDLRKGLPDSVDFCGETLDTNIRSMIPSDAEVNFYHQYADLSFRAHSLFDTLYLRFDKQMSDRGELFTFLHPDVPLKSSVKVTLKPSGSYAHERSHVYAVFGDKLNYVGGTWQKDGSITCYTRDLVTFTIASDTIPPVIKPVIINNNEVYFKIADERSGIKNYRATLNGEFILMRYEYKKDLIWSVRKNNRPLAGEFVLEVEDNAGNVTVYQKTL